MYFIPRWGTETDRSSDNLLKEFSVVFLRLKKKSHISYIKTYNVTNITDQCYASHCPVNASLAFRNVAMIFSCSQCLYSVADIGTVS